MLSNSKIKSRKAVNKNETKVTKLVEKGYENKIVKISPLAKWLVGKIFTFSTNRAPDYDEIYALLQYLPVPKNLPRSKSGKKIQRHKNSRKLTDVLLKLHSTYTTGDVLGYTWVEIYNHIKKCSWDADTVQQKIEEQETITDAPQDKPSSNTYTTGIPPEIDETLREWNKKWEESQYEMLKNAGDAQLENFTNKCRQIVEMTKDALLEVNNTYRDFNEHPGLQSKFGYECHKIQRQMIADICKRLGTNDDEAQA